MIPKRKVKRLEVNLIPLINVIFLLLIFFLVAGTNVKPDVMNIDVPEAKTSQKMDNTEIVILLSYKGDLFLNNKKMPENRFGTILKRILITDPHQPIIIKADAELKAEKLLKLLRIISNAGGTNISIAATIA